MTRRNGTVDRGETVTRGLMCPPYHTVTHLMRMTGDRQWRRHDGRGWMEINPELPWPSLTRILWLAVLIVGFVATVAVVHGNR